MLERFHFENIIKSKIAVGIEIILLPETGLNIRAVVLKKHKSVLTTESQFENIYDVAELANKIDIKLPVVLSINGKGVIHRRVSYSEGDTTTTTINKILPNANVNDFYVQQEIINSSQIFVSIVRANIIDELILELKKNGITNIAGCFLGPFVLNSLMPLVDKTTIKNENLVFENYQLQVREDKISDVIISDTILNDEPIAISKNAISSKLFIAFASALLYFINFKGGIINATLLDNTIKESQEKEKFSFWSKALLISSFLILMINYFIFNHYWTKNNELNAQLVANQTALKKYNTLQSEFSQKKEFLEQNGLLESAKSSYYIDRLASDLPTSITWTDVNFYPLKKKNTEDDPNEFSFENKKIIIAGKCNRNTDLNDWMKEIKKKSWIETVSLLNYKQDNAADDGLFLIELKLN